MNAPCKDCTNRAIGCHSECKDYKDYRNDRDNALKDQCVKNDVGDYFKTSIIKTKYKHVESVKSRIIRRINYK